MIKAIICQGIGFSAGVKYLPTLGFGLSGAAPVAVVTAYKPTLRGRRR